MFSADIYRARRAALASKVASGLILLPGAHDAAMRYRANMHPFVQDGSFAYFFGIDAPDHAGLIDADSGEAWLVGPEDGPDDVLWHGPRASLAERGAQVGVDAVIALPGSAETIAQARAAGRQVHFPPPYRGSATLALADLLDIAPSAVANAASASLIAAIVALREVKDAGEIAEMERGLAITAAMHAAAMQAARPGVAEVAVVGEMAGIVAGAGVRFAYPPIFTRRGEVLHNFHHHHTLQAGDLAINDSGATSPLGYASDITRTLPVGGRFDARQSAIYDVVLAGQEAAIAAMRPGVPYRDVHLLAARTMTAGLVALGLLRGDPDALVADGVHALFFPHGLGHAIGLDTHDMEALGEECVGYNAGTARSTQFGMNYLRLAKPLRAGMVVTVEPGLYFIDPLLDRWQAEDAFAGRIVWDEVRSYAGMGGVRIEDNVLVTSDGAQVLGPAIPKARADVAAAMA